MKTTPVIIDFVKEQKIHKINRILRTWPTDRLEWFWDVLMDSFCEADLDLQDSRDELSPVE